jgi:hypothetical protein
MEEELASEMVDVAIYAPLSVRRKKDLRSITRSDDKALQKTGVELR